MKNIFTWYFRYSNACILLLKLYFYCMTFTCNGINLYCKIAVLLLEIKYLNRMCRHISKCYILVFCTLHKLICGSPNLWYAENFTSLFICTFLSFNTIIKQWWAEMFLQIQYLNSSCGRFWKSFTHPTETVLHFWMSLSFCASY